MRKEPILPPKGYRELDPDEIIIKSDKVYGFCPEANRNKFLKHHQYATTPRILSQWSRDRYFRKSSKAKVPTKIEIKFTDVLGNVATRQVPIWNWARLAHDLKVNSNMMEHEFLEEMVKFMKYEALMLFQRIRMDVGIVSSQDKKE